MSVDIKTLQNYIYKNIPMTYNFMVVCELQDAVLLEKFKNMLIRKGKARIELSAQIKQNGQLAVAYDGVFVALRHFDK